MTLQKKRGNRVVDVCLSGHERSLVGHAQMMLDETDDDDLGVGGLAPGPRSGRSKYSLFSPVDSVESTRVRTLIGTEIGSTDRYMTIPGIGRSKAFNYRRPATLLRNVRQPR